MSFRVVPICIILCLSLLAGKARADDRGQALIHFKAGISFIKADDYESAIGEFQKSMSLYPNKGALFNLANSYKALSRYGEALDAFERLKAEFGDKLKKEMRDATLRNEQEIRDLTAQFEIRVDRDNAEVMLDDRKVGNSPLKPLVLIPGMHKVAVSLEGYERREQKIEGVAGTKQVVTFVLVPEKATVEPAIAETEVQPEVFEEDSSADKKSKTDVLKPIFWSGVGGTVAVGIVAGVFWGLAASNHGDWENQNNKMTEATPTEVASMSEDDKNSILTKRNDAGEKVEKYGNLALGFSIGAGVLAVATAVVFAVDLSRKNKEKTSPVSIGPNNVVVAF